MRFTPTKLAGAYIIEPQPHADSRGLFARTFCAETFARHGLETEFLQCNLSFSSARGTLRGLHYQAAPHPEAKLVRATRVAMLIATHNMELAGRMDRRVSLEAGRVVELD